jgi:ankyrin repeat protein
METSAQSSPTDIVNSVQQVQQSSHLTAVRITLDPIVNMDFFVEPDNIWVASSDGNLADVKKLISSGVDVNAQDEYGYSPL